MQVLSFSIFGFGKKFWLEFTYELLAVLMHINTTTLREIKQNSFEPIFTDKKLTLLSLNLNMQILETVLHTFP